jgi:hypothetical protein
MNIVRKRFFIGLAIIAVVGTATLVISSVSSTASSFLSSLKSFSVTVDNQSDYDILSIETGLLRTDSKDMFKKSIKSGQKIKIKPKLSLRGEGAIYMTYINSRGESITETVCGYTEYLSGYSEVTISNERITVVQQCN